MNESLLFVFEPNQFQPRTTLVREVHAGIGGDVGERAQVVRVARLARRIDLLLQLWACGALVLARRGAAGALLNTAPKRTATAEELRHR